MQAKPSDLALQFGVAALTACFLSPARASAATLLLAAGGGGGGGWVGLAPGSGNAGVGTSGLAGLGSGGAGGGKREWRRGRGRGRGSRLAEQRRQHPELLSWLQRRRRLRTSDFRWRH
jgi:hypothetical protein